MKKRPKLGPIVPTLALVTSHIPIAQDVRDIFELGVSGTPQPRIHIVSSTKYSGVEVGRIITDSGYSSSAPTCSRLATAQVPSPMGLSFSYALNVYE